MESNAMKRISINIRYLITQRIGKLCLKVMSHIEQDFPNLFTPNWEPANSINGNSHMDKDLLVNMFSSMRSMNNQPPHLNIPSQHELRPKSDTSAKWIPMLPNPMDLFNHYRSNQILQFIMNHRAQQQSQSRQTFSTQDMISMPDVRSDVVKTNLRNPIEPPTEFNHHGGSVNYDALINLISILSRTMTNPTSERTPDVSQPSVKMEEDLLNFSKLSANASSSSPPSLSQSTFSIPNLLAAEESSLKRDESDCPESFTLHSSTGSLSPPSAVSDRLTPPTRKQRAQFNLTELLPKHEPSHALPASTLSTAAATSTVDSKQYTCHLCTKVYYSMSALKMHIRTHTLPCKCHICGKAFSRMWLLNGHIRTHTGEKPFSCGVCARAFADRSNLRAHMQTHSDVKKYKCPRCGKTFSRMGLLTKHKTSTGCGSPHTYPVQADVCEASMDSHLMH